MGMKFYTNVTDRNIEGGNNVRSIYPILDKAMNGIRVEEYEEIGGLDTNLHEESAYNFN